MSDEVNLSVRLKDDQIVLKLGDTSKVLSVAFGDTDEIRQLVRILLSRRQEIVDKRRRDTLSMIKNKGQ